MTAKKNRGGGGSGRGRTAAEWVLFGTAAGVVLLVVVVLALDWLNGAAEPPAFVVSSDPVVVAEGGHQVPVTIENTGGQAAAEVVVRAELTTGREVIDAEETIDFLAGGEDAAVTFVFAEDPRAGRLAVQVVSYREP